MEFTSFDINVHELAAFPFPFTLWVGFLCMALRPNNRWAGLVLDCIYQAIIDLGVENHFRFSQRELSTVLHHDFLKRCYPNILNASSLPGKIAKVPTKSEHGYGIDIRIPSAQRTK